MWANKHTEVSLLNELVCLRELDTNCWGVQDELTVKVGMEASSTEVADSARELELSSLRTFWASSATLPYARTAQAIKGVNLIVDVVVVVFVWSRRQAADWVNQAVINK